MPKRCGWPVCLPAPNRQGFLSKNGLFPVMLSGIPSACLTPPSKRFMAKPACPTENMIRVSIRESAATLTAELVAIPRSMELKEQIPFIFFSASHVPWPQ